MAERDAIAAPPARSPWVRRTAIGVAALLGLILMILVGGYLWLDSSSGHRFIKHRIEALQFDNGLRFRIGAIEGSVFGALQLKDVTLRDPKGVFASSETVAVDWRPLAFLGDHVDVRSVTIPTARLLRRPEFVVTPITDEPLLPDIDIDIGRLEIGALDIAAPVTGQRHGVTLSGEAHIADRRAVVTTKGRALVAPGVAGGDVFALRLDAVPESNRFDVALDLTAPANGLVAGLTGKALPMTVQLAGQGNWQKWDGVLRGQSGGDQLADVELAARDGTFIIRGTARPGLFVTGPSRNLLEPVTKIDLSAAADQRRFTVKGTVSSDNFTLAANGLIDLGRNRLDDLAIDFRLLKPSVLAARLTSSGVTAALVLNGAFVAPEISYSVNAAQLGFDDTSVVGLRAQGSAKLDSDQWRIPLQATVQRIAGLKPAYGELLTNVRLDGDFAYSGGRLLSDNLKIKSSRIDATAIVVADLNQGLYTGGLKGRINGYRVESVGIFNIDSDIDLKTGNDGTFALTGTIRATSSRILNDGARELLGGNALIVADVSYGSDGIGRLRSLRVSAPDFRLTSGSGTYSSSGAIALRAQGASDQYGPLQMTVSGTVASPVARIVAARPGFGVGLTNVIAVVRGNAAGYGVTADGESDYGPFTANVDILAGKGPLTIDLKSGTSFAGVGLGGRIRQTAAGPFAGQLAASGSGINGQLALSAFAGKQRAVVAATAADTVLPGPAGLAIQRAIIDADIILYDQPHIVADVQVAELRMRELRIAAGRAKIDYRGGQGTAQVVAEGRNRVPFRFAANATLDPDLWRVALTGRANGIDFKTASPARIIPEGDRYKLLLTTITLSQGSIQLAGDYGAGMNIQSRLQNVNLALLNPFYPGLGFGGTATGSLDFAQASPSAFPRADARLQIDDFTRTNLASVSQPVDVYVVGRLLANGGNARAVFRRRGAVIGQMQVDLTPLPPEAGQWQTRLLAAPLSGGLRYNGPASTLFSLAALPDQDLSGLIGVAADFSGRVQRPSLAGVVRANNLIYENNLYGTRLTNLRVRGTFTNDQLEVTELTAKAGGGTISGKGFVSLSSDKGFPIQLALDLDRAQLARGNDLAASATGQVQFVNSAEKPMTLSGKLRLPETRYRIVREGSVQVATLTGIRRKAPTGRQRITGSPDPISSAPGNINLEIDLVADNQIFVTGMGLNSEWSADIKVRGTTGAPRLTGGIDLVRGTLGFAGRSFELQTGRLRFADGTMSNPTLQLTATGDADDVTVNVNVAGTAENPRITFSSTPSLPQDEIMARILFGNSIGELSSIQAVQLAASLSNLRGGRGGLNPLGVLQSSVGIDRLRILGADAETGRGTSIAAGQYISNDVYIEIITDARGYTATQLEISLTPALSVLSSVSSFGGSNVNIRYRKDY